MPNILTKAEWAELWRPIDPNSAENRDLPLSTYAALCDAHKNAHPELTPAQWSNGRYEVYLESLLKNGVTLPASIVADIDKNANRYLDVPLVGNILNKRIKNVR